MNIITRLLLLGAVSGTALLAQDTATSMDTPPPPPPASAPAPEPVRVDGLIHVQQLPTAAQLMNDAETEHMAITRMEQLADRIVVTYRYASGNTRTFAYTTALPADPDTEVAAAPAMPAPAPSPTYTVVYTEPAPVYYSSYPRYYRSYDPYYWPSSSFSLGLGFGRGFGTYGNFGYSNRPRYNGPSYHGHGGRRH